MLVETDSGDQDQRKKVAEERILETIGLTCVVTVLGAGILPRFEDRASRVIDRRHS